MLKIIALITFLLTLNPEWNIYPATGIVTEICYEADYVVFETCNGNAFSFYGVEDWAEGDLVSALMCDNGTPYVTDDFIVGDPLYAGYIPEAKHQDTYLDCGVITYLDYNTGWCYYTNGYGREVLFFAEDDGFIIGELVSAEIDGKGTITFEDDEVIRLKGCGMVENFGGELLTAGE